MFSLLRHSHLQLSKLRHRSPLFYIFPPVTLPQIRKMSAKTIAVLDESELKDGELLVLPTDSMAYVDLGFVLANR